MYVFFSDYIRCGGESGQCIRIMDKCNGIEDCQNGWDEDIDTCVSPAEQAFFVERGGRLFRIAIIAWRDIDAFDPQLKLLAGRHQFERIARQRQPNQTHRIIRPMHIARGRRRLRRAITR